MSGTFTLDLIVVATLASSGLNIALRNPPRKGSIFCAIRNAWLKVLTVAKITIPSSMFSTTDAHQTFEFVFNNVPGAFSFDAGLLTLRLTFEAEYPPLLYLTYHDVDRTPPMERIGQKWAKIHPCKFEKGTARMNPYGVLYKVDIVKNRGQQLFHEWVLASEYDEKVKELLQERNNEYLRERGDKRSFFTNEPTTERRKKIKNLSPEIEVEPAATVEQVVTRPAPPAEAEDEITCRRPRGRAPQDETGTPMTWDKNTGHWVRTVIQPAVPRFEYALNDAARELDMTESTASDASLTECNDACCIVIDYMASDTVAAAVAHIEQAGLTTRTLLNNDQATDFQCGHNAAAWACMLRALSFNFVGLNETMVSAVNTAAFAAQQNVKLGKDAADSSWLTGDEIIALAAANNPDGEHTSPAWLSGPCPINFFYTHFDRTLKNPRDHGKVHISVVNTQAVYELTDEPTGKHWFVVAWCV